MATYSIAEDVIVCGKSAPDTVSDADLEAAGAITEQLISAGVLTVISTTKETPTTKTSEE